MSALGLIAGGGQLPRAVAQAVRASGRAVFVVPDATPVRSAGTACIAMPTNGENDIACPSA